MLPAVTPSRSCGKKCLPSSRNRYWISVPGQELLRGPRSKASRASRTIEFVERDFELLRIGKELVAPSSHPALQRATWQTADLRTFKPAAARSRVLSYAIGELNSSDAKRAVEACIRSTQVLVIIEPGTPKAFERMADIRKQVIADGARIAAPCPHENECPLLLRGDWCHFAERLERTAEHRRIKGGSLGYEDEKFSYLAATRLPVPFRTGRIVRHPQIHSGYVQLAGLCRRRSAKNYRHAARRKRATAPRVRSEWGDRWPPS